MQGAFASNVYYIERGRVELTSVSPSGKEATVALLSPGMFFGEACLTSQAERLVTARALTDCSLVSIDNNELRIMLREHPETAFVQAFLKYLLDRSREFEQHLIDQVFNSCERRLARVLIMLAYSNRDSRKDRRITGITHETLAGLVGTSRARVTVFMARFRRLDLIDYKRREILVRPALRDALRLK